MPVDPEPVFYQPPKRGQQSKAGQGPEKPQNVVKLDQPASRKGASLKGRFLGSQKIRMLRKLRF